MLILFVLFLLIFFLFLLFLLIFIATFIDRGLFLTTRAATVARGQDAEKQVIAVRGRIEPD